MSFICLFALIRILSSSAASVRVEGLVVVVQRQTTQDKDSFCAIMGALYLFV
jgi:phage portal protein BeeE